MALSGSWGLGGFRLSEDRCLAVTGFVESKGSDWFRV